MITQLIFCKGMTVKEMAFRLVVIKVKRLPLQGKWNVLTYAHGSSLKLLGLYGCEPEPNFHQELNLGSRMN